MKRRCHLCGHNKKLSTRSCTRHGTFKKWYHDKCSPDGCPVCLGLCQCTGKGDIYCTTEQSRTYRKRKRRKTNRTDYSASSSTVLDLPSVLKSTIDADGSSEELRNNFYPNNGTQKVQLSTAESEMSSGRNTGLSGDKKIPTPPIPTTPIPDISDMMEPISPPISSPISPSISVSRPPGGLPDDVTLIGVASAIGHIDARNRMTVLHLEEELRMKDLDLVACKEELRLRMDELTCYEAKVRSFHELAIRMKDISRYMIDTVCEPLRQVDDTDKGFSDDDDGKDT